MTPEGKVKSKIVKGLKELRAAGHSLYWFTPIGSVFGKSGVPDIVICFDGRFVGVEVKAPGKLENVTPLQARAHNEIRDAGGTIFVTDNAEEFIEGLKKWANIATL